MDKIPSEFYYLFHIYFFCKKVEVVGLTLSIKSLWLFIPELSLNKNLLGFYIMTL
jgi:hypothetical protein